MFGYVKAGPGITEIENCITQYFLHFFSWKLKKNNNNFNCNNVKFNGASDKSLLTLCVDGMP